MMSTDGTVHDTLQWLHNQEARHPTCDKPVTTVLVCRVQGTEDVISDLCGVCDEHVEAVAHSIMRSPDTALGSTITQEPLATWTDVTSGNWRCTVYQQPPQCSVCGRSILMMHTYERNPITGTETFQCSEHCYIRQ